MQHNLILITGKRQIGKSVLCQKLITALVDRNIAVSGLLTHHTGYHDLDVSEIHSGQRYPLTLPYAQASDAVGRFRFDPDAIARSKQALKHAFPTQVFVLDELGPLELKRHQGWHVALELLAHESYTSAIIVVRPDLLADAIFTLGHACYTVAAVNDQTRDRLASILLAQIEDQCA